MDNCWNEFVIKQYHCLYDSCGKHFSTKFNLRRHIEACHMHLKPYQCSSCSSTFSTKQLLNDHFNRHTGEAPFSCEICGAAYKNSSRFSYHRRRHKEDGLIFNDRKRKHRPLRRLEFLYDSSMLLLEKNVRSGETHALPGVDGRKGFDVVLPTLEDIDRLKNT